MPKRKYNAVERWTYYHLHSDDIIFERLLQAIYNKHNNGFRTSTPELWKSNNYNRNGHEYLCELCGEISKWVAPIDPQERIITCRECITQLLSAMETVDESSKAGTETKGKGSRS